MARFLDMYCGVLKAAIALCLAAMCVLVFSNVVLRYVFNSGIATSEELSRWLLVWLTFLGAIVAMRQHAHLGVDTLIISAGTSDPGEARAALEMVAREVLPAFRS